MPTCKAPDGVYDYGDVSGDRSIGFTDIVNIANHINGSVPLTGDRFIRADLNGDGIVDQADMDLLAAYIQNPGTVFPVCATGGIDPDLTTPSVRSLEVGSYNIVVTKSNYNPVYARINVSSTGQVSCTDAVCLASGYPRVEASGTSVKVYMAAGVADEKCAWIATQNTSMVSFISEMILAYNNLKDLGFTVHVKEISDGILMYNNLGTPQSLWGC